MKKINKFYFGEDEVSKDQKVRLVNDVFDSVSKKYDLMNDILSFGTHRIWKDILINMIISMKSSNKNFSYLDLACGTGDIAYKLLKKNSKKIDVFMMDINEQMILQAKQRKEHKKYMGNLCLAVSDAENIPLVSKSMDCITIAFGIRNVASVDVALKEIYRVLKYGGKFLCLEFSQIELSGMDRFYEFYSKNIIPELGNIIADDRSSYKYLIESIKNFPKQDEFSDMINDAGFTNTKYKNLSGGIAAIHSAWKI
tara:strand:- start:63523 stop:64284 length:762 start_codon:yes stop_codon:yes gene_type:complete